MISLTPQVLVETALWIQLCDRKYLKVDFSPGNARLHLPSQQLLSLYCSASQSDVMAILCEMEKQHLIAKEERVGIWTTPEGNRIVADIIEKRYRKQARVLLGQTMLQLLLERLRTSVQESLTDDHDKEDDIRLSCDDNEKPVLGDRKILKLHNCECCRKEFLTNDTRKKYCDQCKHLPRHKKIGLRKIPGVKE